MTEETARALLRWFEEHKRDLPWRRTRDPYAIWVSEIMLQQTRVAAVLDHYARWMERFPSVAALAAAEEAEVLTLWSGLGYYRRARMLHRAAQVVAAEHGGVVPGTAAGLRALPGIGEYTSAAIASIAFEEAVAVVDGNVERVVTRLAGLVEAVFATVLVAEHQGNGVRTRDAAPLPKGAARASRGEAAAGAAAGRKTEGTAAGLARAIRAGATALLVQGRAGDSNQAMMELGATVCLPRAPLCLHCPVQPWCRTRGEHMAEPRKKLVARSVAYALVVRGTDPVREVLLRQRPAGASLMAGMWELPELNEVPLEGEVVLQVKHAITVTNYAVRVVRLGQRLALAEERWVLGREVAGLPLTGLARKVLKRLGLWPGE
ncbi:A/G-specific adenine glycosylase [Acidipila sp. EB88]|uniref:A/G-specific adenine glycosylase n=1 Tax=Acidipila sp. EB88 TaxID=2305226 RepID=UPI000F5F09BC|nr:A/G-specific adenine glycosylase [Acidipila sp. EB88]RRA47943.1 A/G-specific adenine glycosylase [Acidipila sp. EB88]